ncbi:MAG: hypothetical protein NTX66_01395, partial [Candidatus Falkowbacteria bacterium]|nr:hypothetical protein [Candidatus Falkowbacteria bacterium]
MKKRSVYLLLIISFFVFVAIYFIFFSQLKKSDNTPVVVGNINNIQTIGRLYSDASPFLSAIASARIAIATGTVTGLIVPHHL